ncbi:MAG TPA: hypothetical protein VFK02_30525 [Kofleriaceae bacterium]|nr:hypothetical protein [Kofleriaceae bacterium]
MNDNVEVVPLSPDRFALELSMLRGTAAYAGYLGPADRLDAAIVELADELAIFASDAEIKRISPRTGDQLVAAVARASAEIIIADVRSFTVSDWALIDRRRSAVAHPGLLVFVTTVTGFGELMRSALNLASWLGSEVFAYPDPESELAAQREKRLAALRAWASRADAEGGPRTDREVIEAARAGRLQPEPEYAEWLVLLGCSDLIGSAVS